MPFDPEHFLALCKDLANMKTSFVEANYRSIISRSYYSAHLYAREVMRRYFPTSLSKTGMARLGEEHERVIHCLTEKGHYEIATKLDAFRRKRGKADYDLDALWDFDIRKEANNSVTLSEYIINQIKASPLLKRS